MEKVMRKFGRRKAMNDDRNHDQEIDSRQFYLFILGWLLALYPFYSKMNGAFGPSQVGNPKVISTSNSDSIEQLCFDGVQTITATEGTLMAAFELLAFLPISLFVLLRIFHIGLQKHHSRPAMYQLLERVRKRSREEKTSRPLSVLALVVIPLLGASLLWVILRARSFQQDLSAAIGNQDQDGTWAFGQIVAVTMFVPVAVDVWSAWQEERCEEGNKA
jgi:hypothetical protein